MKRNNILILVTLLVSSLISGCGDKSILLNDDVIVEQAIGESEVVVKEKDFKLEIESGVSFEPKYIGHDGVYGLTYKRMYLEPKNEEDYIVKKVSKDGVISDTSHNIEEDGIFPYSLQVNDENEIVYNNYLKNEEKVIMKDVVKNSSELGGEGYIEKEFIEGSPYIVVKKRVGKDMWVSTTSSNIINVDTGEIFTGGISYERFSNGEIYFYLKEKDIVYSINMEGLIKQIILKDGKIEEKEYDRINISYYTGSNYYGIYRNGLETRIIYTELGFGSNTIGSQFVYKVATKEHEIFYDKKSSIGSFLNIIEMLPNGLMMGSINGEYVLVKFEIDGIKLIHKFDFSNEVALSDEVLEHIEVVSDEKGEEIIIKLVIKNNKSKEIREKFKMYEIIT